MPEGLSAVSHRVRLSPQFRAAPKEGLGCGDGNGLFNLPAYLPKTAKRRFPEFSRESGALKRFKIVNALGGLQPEQGFLGGQAAGVAGEASIRPHHPVAWNQN